MTALRAVVSQQGIAQLEFQVSPTNAFPQAGQLNRAVFTALQSWSVNGGGIAITQPTVVNLAFGGNGAPFGTRLEVIIAPSNQHLRALNLANAIMANQALVGQTGPDRTLLLSGTDVVVGSIPIIPVDDMTTTIMIGLSGVRGRLNWEVINHSLSPAGYDVLDLGPGENRNPLRMWIGTSFAIASKAPNQDALLWNALP